MPNTRGKIKRRPVVGAPSASPTTSEAAGDASNSQGPGASPRDKTIQHNDAPAGSTEPPASQSLPPKNTHDTLMLNQTMDMQALKMQHQNLKLQLEIKKIDLAIQEKQSFPAKRHMEQQDITGPPHVVPKKTRKLPPPSATVTSAQQEKTFQEASDMHKDNNTDVLVESEDEQEQLTGCAALMAGAIKDLYGQESEDFVQTSKASVLSPFLMSGATVSQRIRNKICNFEYIELSLLAPFNETKDSDINVGYNKGSVSNISLSTAKARKASHIFEWLRWFTTYSAIYTAKYPNEAPALFTYISRIINLHKEDSNGFLWREYDESFRRIREFSQLTWHRINNDIMFDVKSAHKAQSNKPSNSRYSPSTNTQTYTQSNSLNNPKKCNGFNLPAGCSNPSCIYAHKCKVCNSVTHGSHKCYKNNSRQQIKPVTGPGNNKKSN